MTGTSPANLLFDKGWWRLAPAGQTPFHLTTKSTTRDKKEVCRRKKKVTVRMCTARTVSKDANFDAIAEILRACQARASFPSETMHFQRLLEVLAWTFYSACKTRRHSELAPSGQLDGLCKCLQRPSYKTVNIKKTTQSCGGNG